MLLPRRCRLPFRQGEQESFGRLAGQDESGHADVASLLAVAGDLHDIRAGIVEIVLEAVVHDRLEFGECADRRRRPRESAAGNHSPRLPHLRARPAPGGFRRSAPICRDRAAPTWSRPASGANALCQPAGNAAMRFWRPSQFVHAARRRDRTRRGRARSTPANTACSR